jgi:hypothetical protein
MTPTRLRECLDILRWTTTDLARLVSRDPTQVKRWLAGARIPVEIAEWLESRVRQAERTPPPSLPDQRGVWLAEAAALRNKRDA